jgi:hypothetical protein
VQISFAQWQWYYNETFLFFLSPAALLLGLGLSFSFLISYTVDRTPWTGDQPVARPLPTHRKYKHGINAHGRPCLQWVSNLRSQCWSEPRQFSCDWHFCTTLHTKIHTTKLIDKSSCHLSTPFGRRRSLHPPSLGLACFLHTECTCFVLAVNSCCFPNQH